MVRPLPLAVLCFACCLAALPQTATADSPPLVVPDRRVYVPLEELDVVVDQDARGVLLPKALFQDLVDRARRQAAATPKPPAATVLPRCDYTAHIVGDHLLISAKAELHQFHPDWQAWSFPLQRVAVERAQVDAEAALVGRGPHGELTLLTPKAGKHQLELDLSTELVTLGSDQAAAFSLLGSAAGELRMSVPAGKRLIVDGLQWERPAPIDEPAEYRIPVGGRAQVQLRITDRSAERTADALLFAATGYGLHVTPGEATWHALTTLTVFGRPVDRLVLSVPGYLEIADVESTGLESWQLGDDPANRERTVITLTFGQPFEGLRKITLRGVMTTPAEAAWTVPSLTVSQATAHVGQVVVQHPAGVRLQIAEAEGVRRATREQQPVSDMPDDMTQLAAVASLRFDAWREDFTLRLVTQPKQRELHAAVAAVLDAASSGLEWQAALTLTTKFAPLFEADVAVPADWTVSAVATADGQPLRWESLPELAGRRQVRVRLASAVAAGASTVVKLQLRRDLEGWPVETEPVEFPIPELTLPQATLSETAYVIRGDDDLEVAVEDVVGLDAAPLQADFERLRFQSQDTRYSGRLKVSRKPARLAAQHVAFYRLDPQTVRAALFVQVTVEGGGARDLLVSLPEDVSGTVRFRAHGALLVEQQPLTVENARRRWRLKFAERVHGVLWLATELELPRTADPTVKAPLLAVENADREFGSLVVEAGPEQRLSLAATDAQGQPLPEMDPLELPRVPYQPKERMVALYRSVAAGASLVLTEERFAKASVPTAVCPRLAMLTIVSRTGEVQQRAEYQLHLAGVQQLRIELPETAQFWAALLDGQPVEVRRAEGVFLAPIQGSGAGAVETKLELFYRQQQSEWKGSGEWKEVAPVLSVLSGQGTALPVEVLEQTWQLVHPSDTLVIDAHGPVEPADPLDTPGWLVRFRERLRSPRWEQAGGVALFVAIVSGVLAFLVLIYRRSGSRLLVGAMTVVGIMVVLALLLPAVQQSRKAARVSMARHELRQRGIAAFDFAGSGVAEMGAPASTSAPMVLSDEIPAMDPFSNGLQPELGVQDAETQMGRRLDRKQADGLAGVPIVVEGKSQVSRLTKEAESASSQARAGRPPAPKFEFALDAPLPPAAEPARAANNEVLGEQLKAENEQLAQQANQPMGAGDGVAPAPGQPAAAALRKRASGLLSLSLQLEPPPNARSKTFRYVGTADDRNAALIVEYLDRRRGVALRWFCFALSLLAAWFTRGIAAGWKIAVVAIGLAIACGLLPLIPVSLHVLWDGMFAGVSGAAALWLLHGCCLCCDRCCSWRLWKTAVWCLVGWSLVASSAAEVPAQEKTPVARVPVLPRPAVIVPYDSAEAPLAADRVWLPHDKYLELYRLAHPELPTTSPAPEQGGIVEALYAAELSPATTPSADAGAVNVSARLTVRSYVNGQWAVALPVRGVAISEARLNGEPAAIRTGESGLQLLVPKPGLHMLDLKFAVPAKLTGAAGSFSLALAPTAAAKFSFVLPQPKHAVRVNGSTSAYRRVSQDERTLIEIPIDKGGDLQVNWQPEQSQGGGAAVIHVDSVNAVSLTDAGVAVSNGFRYRIRQGVVRDVSFQLPEAVKLQGVNGPDVGGWELAGDGPQRKLRVFFRRNVGDTTQLTIDGYLAHRVTGEPSVLAVPDVAPQEITAESGHVAVYAGEQFAVRAEQVQQLSQVNVENFQPEIPVSRASTPPQLLYRFSRRPWSATLRTSRLAPQVTAVVQQGFWVTHRKVQTTTRVLCDLQRVPQSTLELQVPGEWVILDVQAARLKDWYLTRAEASAALTVELDQPQQGQVELVVLAVESRDPAQAAAALRTLSVRGAQKHQRQAAAWFDAGLSGVAASLNGWKSFDPGALAGELQRLRSAPASLAFQSTVDDPGIIGLTLSRAVPRLAANALTSISVTDVAVIYGCVWQWQIAAAAVDTLHVETSDWLADRLDFTGENLREVTSASAGPGRIRWTVSLRGPVTGRFAVAATAAFPPAAQQVEGPLVTFYGANDTQPLELQRHYVLLMNTSLSQLAAVDPSLTEPVQREDVPIVVRQELVSQATEFVRMKVLNTAPRWTISRYVPAAVAQASVNLADLVTVLARDGTYRAAVTYTIKNRGRQFLAVQLPDAARLLSVTVQGRPSRAVTTQLAGQPAWLVALPKTSAADLSFPVQLTFSGKLAEPLPGRHDVRRQEIDLPAPRVVEDHPEFGISVARTRWTVHLPDDLDAAPLDDARRHNLNQRHDAAADDTLVRVLMQDYTDLLNTVESASGLASRKQALNNLKQLGSAISSYSVQLQNDARLYDDNSKLQQRFDKALSLETRQFQTVEDANGNALQLDLRSKDYQQQVNNALLGNSAIISDNRFGGEEVEQRLDTEFNFTLRNPEAGKPAAANAAKSAAEQAQFFGNNLDARQQYQEFNVRQLDQLNRDLSEKKLRAGISDLQRSQTRGEVERFGSIAIPESAAAGRRAGAASGPISGTAPPRDAELLDRAKRDGSRQPGLGGGMGGFGADGAANRWFDQKADKDRADMFAVQDVDADGLLAFDVPALGEAAGQSVTAGLSLPMTLPQSGQTLIFTKALGDPRLALAVRPQQAWNWLLGVAWMLGWIAAVVTLLAALRTARGVAWASRKLPLAVAALAVAGMLVLSGPLNAAATVLFVLAAIVTAWTHRQ